MDIEKIHLQLKKHPIFKNAEPNNLKTYIKESSVALCSFSSDEDICSPLTDNIPVGLIISGKALVHSSDGGKVLIKTVSEGAIFGIANLYSENAAFPTRISAKKSCKVLFISPDDVRSLIENDPSVMRAFMAFLSEKIVYLNKKINSFTAGSAERRLTLFLADNAENDIYTSETSLSALATMLDIGRASLYRALDKLELEGLIERKDRSIILKDRDLLLKKYSR